MRERSGAVGVMDQAQAAYFALGLAFFIGQSDLTAKERAVKGEERAAITREC